MSVANELEPEFLVKITTRLDGEDDAQKQTANVVGALDRALEQMQYDGLIRDYEIESK